MEELNQSVNTENSDDESIDNLNVLANNTIHVIQEPQCVLVQPAETARNIEFEIVSERS